MKNLKKILFLLFVYCILLAGCSSQNENKPPEAPSVSQPSPSVSQPAKTDIPSDEEELFLMVDRNIVFDIVAANNEEYSDTKLCYMGMQFYQGEPVMLYIKMCAEINYRPMENGELKEVPMPNPDCGLYVYKIDGTKELLIPGNPLRESLGIELGDFSEYYEFNWYVDEEGDCYCTPSRLIDGESYLLKIDKTGRLCYKTALDPGFIAEDFCCCGGEMYVVMSGKVNQEDSQLTTRRVVAFDPDTGVLSETDCFKSEQKYVSEYFGEGPDGLYMYSTRDGILKVSTEDGSTSLLLTFAKGSRSQLDYMWNLKDFRVREDGSAEALYYWVNGKAPNDIVRGIEEKIAYVEGERTKVTLRASACSNWLKEQARKFNKTNGSYWVVLEEFSSSNAVDLEEYAKQTNVELTTGKGPDILCGDLMEDYVQGLLDKGVLLELGNRMEAEGIQKEDYLPAAFSSWGGSGEVYGINFSLDPVSYKVRGDMLGLNGIPDIRMLMDALSSMEKPADYYAYYDAGSLLKMFLESSDNLWGTVDWEHGTCDFSGKLFTQILENAKHYSYNSSNKYPSLARAMRYDSIYQFDSSAELEAEGMVLAGVLFDDGCYGAVDSRHTLAINATSPRKEGAWEFLCYLLGEEAQAEVEQIPVNRAVLEAWLEKDLEEVADGKEKVLGGSYIDEGEIVKYNKSYTAADMTAERVEEYMKALEDIRVLPYRTAPILEIIYEEAGAYFSGSKSISDVTETIRNRVQLYLDEHK